jgi:AcrR family transcriptional regulator
MARPRQAPRGIRTPQQARSRRTREKILEAALSCFEELGYDEATTATIARRARIAVGTLYGYFADKRGILLEVLDRTLREIADYVIASSGSATSRIRPSARPSRRSSRRYCAPSRRSC